VVAGLEVVDDDTYMIETLYAHDFDARRRAWPNADHPGTR
jgi:hypothetical protein